MNNIKAIQGDITEVDADIIVNAANKSLLGGGGVDGAIHRKAGIKLLEECKTLHGCEIGEAKMTNGYNLKAKKVIHTVGPVYSSKIDKSDLLKNCYKNSMLLAEKYRMEENLNEITVAFPCISTGLYRYPHDEAANIAINTIKELNLKKVNVLFVCFEKKDYTIYSNLLK